MLNLNSRRLARAAISIAKHFSTRNYYTSMCRAGYSRTTPNHYDCLQPSFQQSSLFNLYKGAMFKKHNFLSTTTSNNTAEDGSEEIET